MFLPLIVMPQSIKQYASTPYRIYGGNIMIDEVESLQSVLDNGPSKYILCFIGGFCDTYYKLIWNVFCESLLRRKQVDLQIANCNNDISHFTMLYMSFNCYRFLLDFIPNLISAGYEVSAISHSWGAKNIVRSCLDSSSVVLSKLITLDCVGRFSIKCRPKNIQTWENIYITDYFSKYSRANLAAIIGGAKQYIEYADINIGIKPPAHHASVLTMLSHSQLISSFTM